MVHNRPINGAIYEFLLGLLELVRKIWSSDKAFIPDFAKKYFRYHCKLTVKNSLLDKNDKVVVPKSMKKDVISKLHYKLLGIEKTKNKAREILFWPQMSKEIKDAIEN